MRKPVIKGLAGIDKAIKSIAGVAGNLNERIQDVAVAIVEHAAGPGNGDVSRALTLVKTISRYKTLNAAYLVGWFRYFGGININLNANDGAGKVSLISKDSKAYRGGFDVDGARVNNWNDAYDNDGNKAGWYQGPPPPEFKPETLGDIAERFRRFVKNTTDLLGKTKDVNGKQVPMVELAEGDLKTVQNGLMFVSRIADTLARHEDVERKAQELAAAMEAAERDDVVVGIIRPAEEPAVEVEMKEQAVG